MNQVSRQLFSSRNCEGPFENGHAMNSRFPKILLLVPIVVAVFSLTMNLVLYVRLRQSNEKVQKFKSAHARIAREQLELKKLLKKQLLLSPEKGATPSPLTPTSPNSAFQSLTEPPKSQRDDPDISRDAYREEIRGILADALETDFPELRLNQAELQELADAVISLRESMENLRHTQRSSDTVEAINNSMEQRDEAMANIERITGMSVVEFMRHAPADGGIDHE